MLEWIKNKNLNSAILSQEEQHRVKELEVQLSYSDLHSLTAWCNNNAKQIDHLFVIAFTNVIGDLLKGTSLDSTQRLFYFETLSLLILLGKSNLDKFWRDQLANVVRVLEEDAVGPRISTPKDAADVYKRVYNYRGCMLAERGDYVASMEHFNITLALDPYFAPAYCNRARAFLELNRLEEAFADCETMYSFDNKYPVVKATYQLVQALYKHKALQEEGTIAELAEEYDLLELLRRYDRPSRPGEYMEQENQLEMTTLDMATATADELNHLGVVQVRSGNFLEAIEAFNQAIERKPGYDKAFFNRAQAYVKIGKYRDAFTDFLFLIRQYPQDASNNHFLARAYKKWKHERGSENIAIDAALLNEVELLVSQESLNEQNNSNLLKKPDYLSRCFHQHQEAMELLNNITDEAMKSYASLPVQRRLQLAAIMERLGQLAIAVDYYNEASEMLSGTWDTSTLVACLEGLGRTQRAQGQMKDAREHLLQAVKLSQERNDAIVEERLYHHLGQLEEEDGQFHTAQSWYRKAESLARKSENWGGVFAALTHLSSLAMKLQQAEELEHLEAECFQLFYEYGEVVFAGPTALPRPQVAAQARDLLFPEGIDIPDSISETSAKGILEQARSLRRDKKYQESIPLYLFALVSYIQLDQPEVIASCLNGLGLIYQALIKEALLQVRKTLILEAMVQVEGDLEVEDVEQFRKYIANETNLELLVEVQYKLCGLDTSGLYRLIYSYIGDLAKKALACHQWVLELCKEMDDLEEEASQISNLGIVEKHLGNLDTARRYQLWAAQVHRKAGALKHAAIDLIDLAHIEECLGDVETGSARRQLAQELLNAR